MSKRPSIQITPNEKFWSVVVKMDTALRSMDPTTANNAYHQVTPLREADRGTWLKAVGEYVDVKVTVEE